MINACPDEWQAKGNIDGITKAECLDRNQCLIVVTADDDIVMVTNLW